MVGGLGYEHHLRPQFGLDLTVGLVGKVALAGLAFGLAGAVFVELTHAIRALATRVRWAPFRPVLGGASIVGLAVLFGRDYLGLSLPLIDRALAGDRLSFAVFALKIVFTAVTLGCAFPGGEVTPLFVVGATLGAALATPLGLPVAALASVGFVAVFAGAGEHTVGVHDHGRRTVRLGGDGADGRRLCCRLRVLQPSRHLLDATHPHCQGPGADRRQANTAQLVDAAAGADLSHGVKRVAVVRSRAARRCAFDRAMSPIARWSR